MEKASTFMARVVGVASLAILNCVPVAAFAAPEYRLGDTPVSFSLSLGDLNEKEVRETTSQGGNLVETEQLVCGGGRETQRKHSANVTFQRGGPAG